MTNAVSEVLRITIRMEVEGATIGVEKTGCDPVFSQVPTWGLAEVLEHVGPAVERAQEVWRERRQGPAYQAPTPPAAAPRAQPAARGRGAVRSPQAKPQPAQLVQRSMM